MTRRSAIKYRIQYRLLDSAFKALGLLPFPVLYGLSDIAAWLADDVARYRRRVVEDNLSTSFPDWDSERIRSVRRKFYRFLTDYFFETVKMGSMSAAQMKERMRFENISEVSDVLSAGRDVTLLLGHYCNWEWVSSLPMYFPPQAECGQIYHVLHNPAADREFLKLRSRFNAVSIPMEETLRTILGWKREGKASITGYIADQAPKPNSIHHWLDFLNHDTPVFTGPERIGRKLKSAVYYLDMHRESRGRYVGKFVKICDDASTQPPMRVTETYFRMLSDSIERAPQFWLWSHKRWKRTRDNVPEAIAGR